MQRLVAKTSTVLAAAFLVAITQTSATTPESECARAMEQGAVCEAANKRAVELMTARGLEEAATVVLDLQTGALIAFAALPGRNGTARA